MCQQPFTLYHPDNSGCCVGRWNAPCVVLHRGLGTPKGTSRPTTTWSKRNLTQFGFEVPSLGCIPASSLCINCTHMISLSKRRWTDPSARSLWSDTPLSPLLGHRLQHLQPATRLVGTSLLRSLYFRCSFSAQLGALLRGCIWESRFRFECGPSRLLWAAQQV